MKISILIILSIHMLSYLPAKDKDISFEIIYQNQNVDVYEKWATEIKHAFHSIVSEDDFSLKINIYITNKSNSWPATYYFLNEAFYADQAVSTKKKSLIFKPIADAPGLQNNEFTFKEALASLIISNYFKKKLPLWAKVGLPIYMAEVTGAKDWVERNFYYYLIISTERNKGHDIKQILSYKSQIDNHKSYSQKVFSWAYTKWLYQTKLPKEKIETFFALQELEELQSHSKFENANSKWMDFIEKSYERALPYRVRVTANSNNKISETALKTFIQKIEAKKVSPSEDTIKDFLSFEIHNETFENISTLLSSEKPTEREYAAYMFGIIADRSILPKLIEIASKDEFKEVRERAAISIKNLNLKYAPQILVNNLNLNDPNHVANTAESIAIVGDQIQAKALVQKLNAIGSPNGYIAIGTTQNYVSDYDVIDGLHKPIIKTFTEGVVLETKVLWVTIVQPKIISALNDLSLNHTSTDAQEWYKWFNQK